MALPVANVNEVVAPRGHRQVGPGWEPIGAEQEAGSIRLALTSRAPDVFRLHAVRHGVRVAVLAGLDVATILGAWAVLAAGSARASATESAALRWLGGAIDPIPAMQLVVAVVVGLAAMGCYGPNDHRRDSGAIGGGAAIGLGLALWSMLWTTPFPGLALAFAGSWMLVAPGLIVGRKILDLAVRVARPSDRGATFAVVVGPTEAAARLIDHPALGENPWCHLAAFFDPRRHRADELPAALATVIRERRIDTVILSGRLSQRLFPVILDVAVASGCQVFSLPRVPLSSTVLPKVNWRNGYPVVELTRPGSIGAKLVVKRGIDIVVSAVGLALLLPLLGLIALAVRLGSPGPILFRQTRIGRGGRRFTILKFRTMVRDAERQRDSLAKDSLYRDPRLFKLARDPRVTPVGAVLRRTSLDELPQLWNVLRGEMSLVGPRPPLPSEVALYAGHHYARFDVKPGITGPWQVSGRNSIRDFEKVIRLETAYIRRWSLTLDLELLLRTVPAVLSRRGAH